ncbi:hypothetical protein M446_3171 [Methylobacterium sp. 4-46]|uniref:hypothetical protein n=1 Tax=unclassified Methylobacterium TaxID=2615210 RepID=UPI000165C96F|nr:MULTISPECIES: hypothetical protein [Methylobacterium]ACA17577.1 hypothetical protein M446_3171 [Methylobacterium sp. 4-46]WFT83253.1 hypothetical protein QA634_16080 [Methylobacterium nodulans]
MALRLVTALALALLLPAAAPAAPERGGAPAAGPDAAAPDGLDVMAFIPEPLRAGIRARRSTADLTPYLREALATGRALRFPAGTYPVCGSLPQASGQLLLGDGVTSTILKVGPCYQGSAAVIEVAVGDSSGIDRIGIVFDQSGATSRDTLRRYPWAIDVRNASRYKIGHLRLSNAWNGINGHQPVEGPNPGGLQIDLLELGMFNQGLLIDGALDFVHVTSVHCFPFDFAADPELMAVWGDGQGTCVEFGRADGLDVKAITTFQNKVVARAHGCCTAQGCCKGAARHIAQIQLDGDRAAYIHEDGDVMLGQVSSTKGADARADGPALLVKGGTVLVQSLRLTGGTLAPSLRVTGGLLSVLGGHVEQLVGRFPAAEVTGGRLMMSNTALAVQEGARLEAGFLSQDGGGVLVATNNTALNAPGAGALVRIGTDLAGHRVAGNDFNGWGYGLPPGARRGQYGPNRVAPFPWTPVLARQAPGAPPRGAAQQGRYWYAEDGLHFEGRVVAPADPSWRPRLPLRIGGLPVRGDASLASRPVTLGEIGGLGPIPLTAFLSAADGAIVVTGPGDAPARGSTGAPDPGGPLAIGFSGFLPLR